MYGILFQHPHAPIHTYPPAASELTRHRQRKRSSHKQQVHAGDDGDKPKVASWRCCAAPQRELGVLGPWGNARNGSSRADGPERLADTALS